MPLCGVQAVEKLLHEHSRRGAEDYGGWVRQLEEVRDLAAGLLSCTPREMAFVGNTSEGLSLVAGSFPWRPGDEILVPRPEFPANVYPWMNLASRGVSVRFVERQEGGRLDADHVERALGKHTRLISVSSVDFSTGYRLDLQALGDLCREKGLFLCVDAIQSLGIVPLDVHACHIHFLAAGGHKWLMGPMGCGILFVEEEAGKLLRPEQAGWKSVVHEQDFFTLRLDFKPDARRFEIGSMNLLGIAGLGASIRMLLEKGIPSILERVLHLNDLLMEGLENRGGRIVSPSHRNERAGILTFVPSADPASLHRQLLSQGIRLSLRNGMLRLSPHFYNQEEEVERFFHHLDRFSSS